MVYIAFCFLTHASIERLVTVMKDEINLTKVTNGCGSCGGCSCGEDYPKKQTKYDNVEPLPESSRDRRDGPGGENVK